MRNVIAQSAQTASVCTRTEHTPTQVESYLNAVGASIEALAKALENHRDKIGPVLRSDTPANDVAKAAPGEMLVPVADRLRSYERHIIGLRTQLESLTERVEA